MRGPVLYFFLLVLRVSFDFISDVINERGEFSEILSKKCFEFVLSKGSNPVPLNLSLVLLPAEIDPILEEKSCKKHALVARGTGRVKIVFTLLTEVVILHM